MVKKYPCECEITDNLLWTRACVKHKKMSRKFKHGTIMACIILQKLPHQLNQYEDQITIHDTFASLREDTND